MSRHSRSSVVFVAFLILATLLASCGGPTPAPAPAAQQPAAQQQVTR